MSKRTLRSTLALLAGLLVIANVAFSGGVASAATYAPINGDGSSWAEPAIDQFSRDVRSQGLVVNYSGDGSAAGRNHYIVQQNDFAATDIAFLTTGDPFGGGIEHSSYAYSYIPIVAGGTVFMYNLTVGHQKITNLRLSGDTITKIFTGQITNWDDKRITKDYGRQLPSQQITVVTRSDGSGASYQFSDYMDTDYHSQWHSFCVARGGAGNCGATEFYPGFGNSVQRNGSDQVANYIHAPTGEGSIGYDEYSYALANQIPVVKLLNSAGYYTLPTASNVAIALQAAKINEDPTSVDFLIQDLSRVYTNPDKRTYPLSSYSYLVVPRTSRPGTNGPPTTFTSSKGQTLSTFLNYVLCGAQQKAGALGYSPLPVNLVQGGFRQDALIPGAINVPSATNLAKLNGCNNPTYHNGVNYLVKDAPFPNKCDFRTAPLTCTGGADSSSGAAGGGGGSGSTSTNNGGTSSSNSAGGGSSSTNGGGTAGSQSGGGGAAATDPAAGGGSGTTTGDNSGVVANVVPLAGSQQQSGTFATLTALELLAALMVPAALGIALRRRRRGR